MRTFTEEEVEEMMGKSIEHDGCKGCAYESEGKHGEHCSVCEGTKQGDMYKRATNADRIRSMSDEELAEFLADPEKFSPCKNCDFHFVDAMNDDCKSPDGWICTKEYAAALIQKWLQSEVEE